jgi:hypothetical protein
MGYGQQARKANFWKELKNEPRLPAHDDTGLEMTCIPVTDLLWMPITQSLSDQLRLRRPG